MFYAIVGAGAAGAASRYGSGSGQKLRLLAAPAPQHWLKWSILWNYSFFWWVFVNVYIHFRKWIRIRNPWVTDPDPAKLTDPDLQHTFANLLNSPIYNSPTWQFANLTVRQSYLAPLFLALFDLKTLFDIFPVGSRGEKEMASNWYLKPFFV
jgi:hypothetical protein